MLIHTLYKILYTSMWYIYVTLFSWFCLEIHIYYFLEKWLYGVNLFLTEKLKPHIFVEEKNYLSEWLTLTNRVILKNSININQFTVTFNLVNRIHHGILPYIYLDIKSHLGFFFSQYRIMISTNQLLKWSLGHEI